MRILALGSGIDKSLNLTVVLDASNNYKGLKKGCLNESPMKHRVPETVSGIDD